MAKSGKRVTIKVKAGEDLSETNILRVIKYLEDEKSTKKEACGMLGISYNTTRLQNIIDNYLERKARDKEIRARKAKQPVTQEEAASMIETYLISGSFEEVSRAHFRPITLVKNVIRSNGADFKAKATDYFKPQLIPESAMAEEFSPGELVWSARYNTIAEVRSAFPGGYWIWLMGPNSQQAAQATEELGSLQHLADLGVNVKRIVNNLSSES